MTQIALWGSDRHDQKRQIRTLLEGGRYSGRLAAICNTHTGDVQGDSVRPAGMRLAAADGTEGPRCVKPECAEHRSSLTALRDPGASSYTSK